ncbi:hypothetical protein C8Q73DRAFT_687309 [Cubamyces lactineus]|nr:hypothetical protein C8Q73DRAFT_699185 [Cubamyces lactineus]KAH9896828.1 hypothetical protein C8Q73DRAFT_687309 [Cubamyces lactineus]
METYRRVLKPGETMDVYVRHRGQLLRGERNETRIAEVGLFDVTITPKRPLRVGSRVRLMRLDNRPDPDNGDYIRIEAACTVEDTGIEGDIVGIRAAEMNVVELVVRNEKDWSMTELAYLSVRRASGVTVELGALVNLLLWVLGWVLVAGREIPTEDANVVINAELPRGNGWGE